MQSFECVWQNTLTHHDDTKVSIVNVTIHITLYPWQYLDYKSFRQVSQPCESCLFRADKKLLAIGSLWIFSRANLCVINQNFLSLLKIVTDDDVTTVLPENDVKLENVEFRDTTTYHWANFDVNATDGKETGFEVVQGPFSFGLATKLDKSKKQVSIFDREKKARH